MRHRWEGRSTAGTDTELNYAAVSRIVAAHLWETGERPDTDTNLPRRLKDRIRRGLLGDLLSEETLGWLIAAFGIAADEQRRLWALYEGSAAVRVLHGTAQATGLPASRGHRTISLHEHHFLGPDGLPQRHLTTQVIEARVEGLRSYPYIFDTAALTVDVLQGGRPSGGLRRLTGGLFAAEIELTRPLRRGETTTLTYLTTFFYDEPPEPCFRRAAFTSVDSVDIRVEFDRRRLPSTVHYTEWAALDRPATRSERRELESDNSVHVFLRTIENAIVGFTWTWPGE